MVCSLLGAKPLSKPVLDYWQLDHEEQTLVTFKSKYKMYTFENASEKYRLPNGGHFVQGDDLISIKHILQGFHRRHGSHSNVFEQMG